MGKKKIWQQGDYLETTVFPEKPFAAIRHLFAGEGSKLVLAGFVYLFKHSPVWVAPIITARIINQVAAGGGNPGEILLLAFILTLFILQNVPTHTLFVRFINGSIRTMEARTRMSLIRRLQQLSFSFHDNTRTGALQTKILRDVENIGVMITLMINTLLSTFITVGIAIGYTLIQKPVITVFYFLTVPIALGLIRVFNSRIKENTNEYRKNLEGMTIRVTEMLSMLPVTRAHAIEDQEIDSLNSRMNTVASSGRKLDILNGIFGSTSWAMFQLFSLMTLLVSAFLAMKGEITIGEVVLYQGFFAGIVNGVNSVINVIPELTKGFSSIQSIGEVLRSPDIEKNEGKTRLDGIDGSFSFDNVSFTYPGSSREVLRNLDISVQSGETIAIVGESGSGKSTIMNLLIGFYRPTSGRILLDGRDMAELDLRDYRRFISVVSQNTILFSGTIRDNITYGMKQVDEAEVRNAVRMANADRFIAELPDGLDTILGENGSRLSGGQRQRIAIARAMIRNPRVIILDEATSALDVESERLVQEAIDRLAVNRTTFIVAHRLSTIRNADKIAVMKRGRLVEFGTHEELLARNGEFAALHALYR